MDFAAFLALISLQSAGIRLDRKGENISIYGGQISHCILDLLRRHKDAILAQLDHDSLEAGWDARPVGPIPDFDRPGEEQAVCILDVFGEAVAVPVASIERLLDYNRNVKQLKKRKIEPLKQPTLMEMT